MAPLSLKVVLDEGAVTRTVMFESTMRVEEAQALVREKVLTAHEGKDYGLFLTSADDEKSGIWLERHRQLDYYMLRDGDQLHYLCRLRNLRVRMLDGAVKTLPVDEAKTVEQLMVGICGRLGITNHDEYGLCHDDEGQDEKTTTGGMGTLTRRAAPQRERDTQLQTLSRKLKTDDHVVWLDQHKTLRELRVDPKSTVLLKRRLFFSDRNVDERDPVQLNLLYVQARDAILEGRHPVTEDKAVEFAGIQCQIHYGDFQEDKHKPGLIENLNEYLPEQYSSSWGIEKKILKEFRKHQGLAPIEAKFLYTKTARDLPTYGVTFFLVKEKQKGKKKLVPRLLGINAESILRLDEVTKEVLQAWPLTQVKTYHAGLAETFTLNFGDYSDKEYSVKTNDAHRIRDILQGYIDIIRRRMEANYNMQHTEHYAICEDNVQASRGHIMERIEHKPSKVVEESFVGPSQIFTYEPGQAISQGTQIVTVQQLVISAKGGNQQTTVVGEVPMRKHISMDFVRKLNRLNSNSVKIVTLLTEPNDANMSQAAKIVDVMEADMPSLIAGVKEAAEKETNEVTKKKLLDELQELSDLMKALSQHVAVDANPEEAQEVSKRIADLSIQMCCALDPSMKKRGEFCRRSRKSFMHDEKIDAALRRASRLAAAQAAHTAIEQARAYLDQEYQGPPLNGAEVDELEKAAADKIAKLNAAIALNLTAYADPENIDYGAAVTSMNTINELMPELANDVKALNSVKDGKNRQELLDAVRALCDALNNVCSAADPDDHQKMQDAAKDYARVSDRLLFTFGRGGKRDADIEKQILDLSKDVVAKTDNLVQSSKKLGDEVQPELAAMLDDASGRCRSAAEDVATCAQLTASSIYEPHCRSALKAAAENLSSSAQHLALTWKPMVESQNNKQLEEELKDRTMDLAKALDRLQQAFAGLDGIAEEQDETKANNKLKFTMTVADIKKKLGEADAELNKPLTESFKTEEELKERLHQRLAQLNAALAALIAAATDRDKQDFETAELAVSTIGELMPDIVRDGKLLSAEADAAARDRAMAELRALCDAAKDMCDSVHNGDLENIDRLAPKFAKSSGKLFFVFNPHVNQDNKNKIAEKSSSAIETASELLKGVEELTNEVGPGTELETAKSRLTDATAALETTTQLTSTYIEDPRCQAYLISAAVGVSAANQHLASVWKPLVKHPEHKPLGDKLEAHRRLLEQKLNELRKACQDIGAGNAISDDDKAKAAARLKFIKSAEAARQQLAGTQKELDKPIVAPKSRVLVEDIREKLASDVSALNAAVAALLAAKHDGENPDYETADNAITAINKLLPQVIKDTKTYSSTVDEASRAIILADLRALCEATNDICASLQPNSDQDLNRSAVKFAEASGRLVYVFDPRADQDREHNVLDLSSSACEKASELLSAVYQLATEADGPNGAKLDCAGAVVADRANTLLATAQLTSPCIQDPSCRSQLLSSADSLEHASRTLASIWQPLVKDSKHSTIGDVLREKQGMLEDELEKLRRACRIPDFEMQTKSSTTFKSPESERQRLQFVKSVLAAHNNLEQLEKDLNKPVVPSKSPVPASLQNKLARNLALLNAAMAEVFNAFSDSENPDYVKAEQAFHEINQLMPQIANDTRIVSASKEPQTRDLMLSDLRALCEHARFLCSLTAGAETQDMKEAASGLASRVADNSRKLFYVVSATLDQGKEEQILDLTTIACQKSKALVSGVDQLASAVQGVPRSNLTAARSHTAGAADTLLYTAQLTAASIHEPSCKATLLSSADQLSSSANSLASIYEPIIREPQYEATGLQLRGQKKEMEDALDKLKAAVSGDGVVKSPLKKAPPPPPPKRVSSSEPFKTSSFVDSTKDFLHRMREDEARAAIEAFEAAEKQKKLKEAQEAHQKLTGVVDSGVRRVQKAADEVTQLYTSAGEVIPMLPAEQAVVVQKQMEHKLATANAAAAKLIAGQHLNTLDCTAACEPATALADVMPLIVQDAKLLRGALDEQERKAFLEDILGMFDATKVLLGAAKNDHRNMNESAVMFGNKSAKLLYVVSTDADPAQEREVFDRTRAIGDSASRLAVRAAERAQADELFATICSQGGECADAAGTMLYTAKLVAPCIQVSECQQTLVQATEELSQRVAEYADAWAPVKANRETKEEIKKETDELAMMLKEFKEDVKSGKLVKRRAVERIEVIQTPLRQLACAILDDAQKRAKQASTPLEQRPKFVRYAADLAQAVRQLDRCLHHSRNAPSDLDKRVRLENAVQELQVAVLMGRPTSDATHTNIVDLTDYVRAVSEEADNLHRGCKEGQRELQMVQEHCEKIKDQAARTMNPDLFDQSAGGGAPNDRSDVAHFAVECDKRVKSINAIIQNLEDGKTKIDLQEKADRLTEASNLLNFATKCDLATTRSASLDATLEELTDLEKKIDGMLVAGGKRRPMPIKSTSWSQSGRGRLMGAVSRAAGGESSSLVPAYAAYLDDVRVGGNLDDPAYKQRSNEHMLKVLGLLKTLTMTNSRHVATWQPGDQQEMAAITGQIIKELDSFDAESSAVDGTPKSVLSEVDLNKLLVPTYTKMQVDQKQISEQISQAASKLSCTLGTLVQSAGKPASLTRTAPSVLQAATHLAELAKYAPVQDIAHSQKIDEASKEMSLQTYNVLKTADLVCQEPNNYASRRKLLDACSRLNDSISQLVRTASPSNNKLHRECSDILMRWQLHQSAAQSPAWSCALSYPHTLAAMQNQRDVIQKLNDETPQSREEFTRSLAHVSAAAADATHCASHAAYLLSISEQHSDLAAEGFVDVGRIQSLSEAVEESCYRIMRTEADQAKEEAPILIKQVQDFQQAITEAQDKIKDETEKKEITESINELEDALTEFNAIVHEKTINRARLTVVIIRILDTTRSIGYVIERVAVIPEIKDVSADAKARSDDVLKNCRNLNTKMLALVREVKASEDDDPMTWVTFGTRKAVLDMFEALVNSVQENGNRAGILEPSQSDTEEDQPKRSFVQVQLDLARKWLGRPTVKPETKASGEEAARTIISLGEKVSEDLKGQEKEEMLELVTSSEELLAECLKKHDPEKSILLMERLKALQKAIERCVVARVVEDFLEGEEPLADLELLADAETDEEKRKFLLERKIAELLANLGRVSRTARVVATAGNAPLTLNRELLQRTDQTELLAPMLVQAAQKRVISPNDQAAIEHYQKLLAEYAESLANIRSLCDQAVDPMDFVQTAGETMQKLREDTNNDNDLQKCAYASTAITKLANRVITVSMSSNDVRKDPELQKALKEAKERLKAVEPGPNARPSQVPDWKVTTAEILRTTGEVESVLGGEMIFKKQQTSDEPIFAAAYDLHTAIRSWSAKDNEIVAVAKRMAVLMAKLSDFMHTDRKRDVIVTAKAIVNESREVAELARKLAHECTDVRIKTNLLKICERIPTISGQLKMLATVKGSLGHQGLKEDQEDMNMLVGNAQNLMLSVQEAVNAAASASVKINSQRGGPRMRWVRKSYY